MIKNKFLMRFTSITVGFSILLLVGLLFSVFSPLNMALSSPTVTELDIEGSVAISYSESYIKNNLTSVSGWGGKIKTTGSITPPTFWKGIHLPLMLDSLVGELDYNISVRSADGWNANLTRQEVNGAVRTFNEENVTLETKAIPVLAFEENNITLDAEDGPLRLVFVGEDNQSILTISTLWIKQVDSIQITTKDSTTSKSSSGNPIWISIPTLILLILNNRRKKNR